MIAGQRLINYSGGERDYRTALRVPLDTQIPARRAKRILLTHGYSEALTRYFNEKGVAASALQTSYGEED